MKYLKARELIEAILNEVLVDDPVTPGQGKAPSLFPKPKPKPTSPTGNQPGKPQRPGSHEIYAPTTRSPRPPRPYNPDLDTWQRPVPNPRGVDEVVKNAVRYTGDPNNRGDGSMKKYGGTRANKLVSPRMKSYGVINPNTGKPVRTLGKLHKRLEDLSPETKKRYRDRYGYRTGSGRLYPQDPQP